MATKEQEKKIQTVYFCLLCARTIDVEVHGESPPEYIHGKKCENCGGRIFIYEPRLIGILNDEVS